MSFRQTSKVLSAAKTIGDLKRFAQGVEGKIDAKLYNVANNIRDTAYTGAPKRTGRMANNTVVEKFSGNGGKGYQVIGKEDYTAPVHQGTYRMPGRPYIKNAFDKHKKEAMTWTARELGLGGGGGSWA